MKAIFICLFVVALGAASYSQDMILHKHITGAVNDTVEIAYIDSITFLPFRCGRSRVYYSGTFYNTVQIGSQCWLKENLNIGTMIYYDDWSKNNSVIEKFCYNDIEANCAVYGGLYQWSEAMQWTVPSGRAQGICPADWHIPNYSEFQTLTGQVSGNGNNLIATGTNISGFSALLAGYGEIDFITGQLGYYGIGNNTSFWSTTWNSANWEAARISLGSYGSINSNYLSTDNAFSVRCVKDAEEFVCGDNLVYGGVTYHTVTIGSQCWMKENLNVGTMVAVGTDQTNNSTIEKYCYNGLESNCTTYGGLYQWAEAVQYLNGVTNTTSPPTPFSGNVQGICPAGWHLPNYYELIALKNYVNSSSNALKAVGQGSGSGAGTNTSGFTALLAGFRFSAGFYDLGSSLFLLSSQEENLITGIQLGMNGSNNIATVYREFAKTFGFSARCLKD